MQRARELFPQARQHLITTKTGQMILEKGFDLASLHVFDKKNGLTGILTTAKSVKSALGSCAVTMQPHLSTRSTLLACALGKPVVTFRQTSLGFLAARRVPRISVFHESDRNAVLIEALGISRTQLVEARPVLRTIDGPTPTALEPLKQREHTYWIGIAPGSIWGTKRWPIENFSILTQKLLANEEIGVALIGGKDEQNLCEEIIEGAAKSNASRRTKLINLAGKTSLDDLRSLFPSLKLVVTNDSSPVHYASAFDVPTIVIFGPTIPAFGFGPLAADSTVIETSGLDCRPCGNHGPQRCPLGHFKCMKQIDVDQVYGACMEHFRNNTANH